MFNSAASEEDRKVFVAVSGGVAHAAAHDKEGVVEELSFLEAIEETINLGEDIVCDDFELSEFSFAFTVVRESVIPEVNLVEIGDGEAHWDFEGGDAGGIGLQCKSDEVEEEGKFFDMLALFVGDGVDSGIGLWFIEPDFGHLEALFDIAYGG